MFLSKHELKLQKNESDVKFKKARKSWIQSKQKAEQRLRLLIELS